MKKILKLIPILLGLLFSMSACVVVDDDPWDDDHEYNNRDWHLIHYLNDGRWYPESRHGLTSCEYDSYIVFHNQYDVSMYDCYGHKYDGGYYEVYNGYLTIKYDNGDRETYRIVEASSGHLIMRAHDGIEYCYIRH